MTLLEGILALVILGLSAVGYLEVFQASARAVGSADQWERATAVAESALEHALVARRDGQPIPTALSTNPGYSARVDVVPWRGRVSDMVVTVVLPDGRALSVHRLVRE
jgi:type II secretory pathway pseudopilin PulG